MPIKGLIASLFFISLSSYTLPLTAQSTAERVYNIFQTSCASSSCHDNDGPVLGLDLQGSGPNAMMQVYDNIVGVTPLNAYADAQGYKYITPGDPVRSFLFRKINDGLDPTIALHPSEGNGMPATGVLDEEEIEIVRQWILYGAPASGEVIDVATISDFYNNNGVQSVPSPPVAPDPEDGFQIHLGPFFIPPGQEDEVFYKFNPMLQDDIEVTGVEVFMGNQSHHFILYKFFGEDEQLCGVTPGASADQFPPGFRDLNQASHASANFLVGAQNPERVDLPYGTAFSWQQETILDLNSHYINSSSSVLSADVYVNVYTQPKGIAAQEMKAIMIPNTDFDIPNDGQEYSFSSNIPVGFCFPSGIYVWATTSHTHQWGVDYDIYKSDFSGNPVEHIFDASCYLDGVPGCATEFYDYQHPPTRVFDPYYRLAGTDWLRHDASYVNNGPSDVQFGFTSEDEMMLFFLFYVQDTAGLTPPPNAAPVANDDAATTNEGSAVNISVLDNDQDADGSLDPLSVTIVSNPSGGTATVQSDGTINYEPNPGFSGTDQFSYAVCDDGDPPICDTAVVTVEVEASTGVFGPSISVLRAYPNPTTGVLQIPANGAGYQELTVVNLQGQVMFSEVLSTSVEEEVRINLGAYGLEDGVYWIRLLRRDGSRGIAGVVLRSVR